ncbi:MAG: spore germination protein, partial [Paenibacillus macerans]|nr:spore germination protein [Paenibacillus macerans]
MPFWRKFLRTLHAGNGKSAGNSRTEQSPPEAKGMASSRSLAVRLAWLKEELKDCSDIIYREFVISTGQRCALIYVRGMIAQDTAQHYIVRSLQRESAQLKDRNIYQFLFEDEGLTVSQTSVIHDLNQGINAVMDAGALLLIDGDARMLTFSISSYPTRAIEETPNESVIRGPREAFIEDLEKNL